MLIKSLALLAALFPSTFVEVPSSATAPKWLVGFWQKFSDEDHQPNDVMEFRSDGTFYSYGYVCMHNPPVKFHIYDGDVYITPIITNKGPIAVVFRPSNDKAQMTFTSPRTRNNAVYKHIDFDPCAGK